MSNLVHQSSIRHSSVHVDNLPVEILQEIFMSTYSQGIFDPRSRKTRSESISVPIHLSHISRRWRQVALSFGELWSYLSLVLDYKFMTCYQNVTEMFFSFLERTKMSPINFHLQFSFAETLCEDNEEARSSLERLILALIENQNRWQAVLFTWYGLQLSPGLKELEISDLPLLRSLSLDAILITSEGDDCPVKVNVSRSSRIESIHLDGSYRVEVGHRQNGLTNVHSLKSLRLSNALMSSSEVALDGVLVPNLEELDYGDRIMEFGGHTILHLIQRSLPPITTLSLHGAGVQDVVLVQILQLLPRLEHLDIVSCPFSTRLMRALRPRPDLSAFPISQVWDGSTICPRLKTLHLSWTRQIDVDIVDILLTSLTVMVELRMRILGTFNMAILYSDDDHHFHKVPVTDSDAYFEAFANCFLQGHPIQIVTEVGVDTEHEGGEGDGEEDDEGEEEVEDEGEDEDEEGDEEKDD